MADDEKKIIIDEDWKAQAQKEKETLKKEESQQHESDSTEQVPDLPETDFPGLVSMLASQAYWSLGVFQLDENDKHEPDFRMAKFNIDMLGMLEEKTKGNLTDQEAQMISNTLGQLRMVFVQLSKQG